MVRRKLEDLAVYQIEEDVESIPFSSIYSLYTKKTSEIVYIMKDRVLYGIVCMGEILRNHEKNDVVRVNKFFTVLTGWNVIKAHEIFQRKSRVNKIPVVNEQGQLLGDYSRWDDMLFIKRNQELLMKEKVVKDVLKPYEAVYVVEPVKKNYGIFKNLVNYFMDFHIKHEIIKKSHIDNKLSENVICIFMDEDERRGTECLCRIEPCFYDINDKNIIKFDLLADKRLKIRLTTYKNFLLEILERTEKQRLNIGKTERRFFDEVNEKATVLFSELQKRGIKCICVCENEEERTGYGKRFLNEVRERWDDRFYSMVKPWPKKENNPQFFGELYQLEDYENETAQKEICDADNIFEYKKNITGKYFNAKAGRRITCFQPEEYIGTIYFLGACIAVGAYTEDQYTIESWLQKKIIENGYKYRVENYSDPILPNAGIECRLNEIEMFRPNDIIIYFSYLSKVIDVESISLEKIFEKNDIPSAWVKDTYEHCNHHANKSIADSLFEMIEPYIERKLEKDEIEIRVNIRNIMQDYIQNKYISYYFSNYLHMANNSVGAIVMTGAPFHFGHRYLIEQAKKNVSFLIIFVIEEDASIFPFEERFKMVEDGVCDLDKIMVVPSGNFVFSKHNNYLKMGDEAVEYNAKYHIQEFVNYIAKPLCITHVFRGKEDRNKILKAYNKVLEEVLPQKGIKYVELPKKKMGNEIISSSSIRSCLWAEEYDKAFALLPESTRKYLTMQIDI